MYGLPAGLEQLPSEVNRNSALMEELDSRVQLLTKTIDEKAEEFMKSKENLSDNVKKEKIREIRELFNKVNSYGEDKVQLATQTYELVDKQIRQLDLDLAWAKNELQKIALEACLKSEKDIKKMSVQSSGADESVTGGIHAGPSHTPKAELDDGVQKEEHGTPRLLDGLYMPEDPNEPTFCYCREVSHGQMIACDNPDCAIEWFHFDCVGLTIKPKGKWFCSDCSKNQKTK